MQHAHRAGRLNAGHLIAEAAPAVELGADADHVGPAARPHPTLSGTIALAAEAFEVTLTALHVPKRR